MAKPGFMEVPFMPWALAATRRLGSPPEACAATVGDEVDQIAIERRRQQAGDEMLEVAGFPVGLAEGAAEQNS